MLLADLISSWYYTTQVSR